MTAELAAGRRQQSGRATSRVVHSARVGTNAELLSDILALHVPEGARVLDATFGLGAFWDSKTLARYRVTGSDLALKPEVRSRFPGLELHDAVDFRALPFADASFDTLVLDPPYMEGLYRTEAARAGQGTHRPFRRAYAGGAEGPDPRGLPRGRLAWQDRVIDAYVGGIEEAHRILVEDGRLIVKCQDAVSANLQRLAHVEILLAAEERGFCCEDLFVLVRSNAPGVSRVVTQVHARKNHSYFLVLAKRSRNPVRSSCRACRGRRAGGAEGGR